MTDISQKQGGWTPGPWTAVHTGYYWHVVSTEGTVTDACPSQFIGGGTIENPSPREEANARLIAAAPDLYESLQASAPMLETLHSLTPPSESRKIVWAIIKQTRAALSRANPSTDQGEG